MLRHRYKIHAEGENKHANIKNKEIKDDDAQQQYKQI